MKERINNAIVAAGVGVSAAYMVVFALFLFAEHIHDPWFRSVQAIGTLGLLASPLTFLATFAALPCAIMQKADIRRKVVLFAFNVFGVGITGWFTVGVFHLWRMGPINPG
jgi:hypothetical protein